MSNALDPQSLRQYPELDGKTFLLGVGGMKCATSWVFRYLEGQTGVSATPLKELHFFNAHVRPPGHAPFTPRLAALVRDYLAHAQDVAGEIAVNEKFQAAVDCLSMLYDQDAYFSHFARLCRPDTRILTEITPQYSMLRADGFEVVRQFFESQQLRLKIVFIMRDPIDRLWSHLRSLRLTDAEIDVVRDWPDLIRRRAVIERSDYWQTIDALDATFPSENILYLFYEDLFAGDGLRQLCSFCGLNHTPATTGRENETPEKAALPDNVRWKLARVLAPQYTFCRERFGTSLPPSWTP